MGYAAFNLVFVPYKNSCSISRRKVTNDYKKARATCHQRCQGKRRIANPLVACHSHPATTGHYRQPFVIGGIVAKMIVSALDMQTC
jgi:hypothetical protein